MEKTPCKWCGEETICTFTKECDRCWELRHRLEYDPALAFRMLDEIRKEKDEN